MPLRHRPLRHRPLRPGALAGAAPFAVLALAVLTGGPTSHPAFHAGTHSSTIDGCADPGAASEAPDCQVPAPAPRLDAFHTVTARAQYRSLMRARHQLAAARSLGAARAWQTNLRDQRAAYRLCYLEVTPARRLLARLPVPEDPHASP